MPGIIAGMARCMTVTVEEVCEGLWLWRQPHPAWDAEADWEPEVSSYAVTSRGTRWLVDPLAPPPSAREAWERIDAHGADALAVLKPDHVRDVDLFARWYGGERLRAFAVLAATTSPGPSSSSSGRAASCPAASWRCTTAAGCRRRRSTCPSSGRSSSPTRSPRRAASCGSGARRGTRSACCRRSGRCSRSISLTCSSPTARPCTTARAFEAALEREPHGELE